MLCGSSGSRAATWLIWYMFYYFLYIIYYIYICDIWYFIYINIHTYIHIYMYPQSIPIKSPWDTGRNLWQHSWRLNRGFGFRSRSIHSQYHLLITIYWELIINDHFWNRKKWRYLGPIINNDKNACFSGLNFRGSPDFSTKYGLTW